MIPTLAVTEGVCFHDHVSRCKGPLGEHGLDQGRHALVRAREKRHLVEHVLCDR